MSWHGTWMREALCGTDMAGQIAEYAAAALANHLGGQAGVVVQGTAPTWYPGLTWVNSASGYSINSWNGSAWAVSAGSRYVALLTADPVASSAVNISDLSEVTTAGYARQPVTFSQATITYPSTVTNTNLITFGPMSAGMALASQWVALVTVSSGTTGYFLDSWLLPEDVQVNASQSFQIGVGLLTMQVQ